MLAGIYAASAFIQRLTDSAAGPLLRFPQHALLGRAQVAVAGTLTIPALYCLARQVAGPAVALLAAMFLAVDPLHVRDSHFAMADVTMTLLVAVSLWLLLEGGRRLEDARSSKGCAPVPARIRHVRARGPGRRVCGTRGSRVCRAALT